MCDSLLVLRFFFFRIKYENLNDIPNTLSQGIKYEAPNIDEAIEKYSVIMNNIRISYKENGEENEFSDIDMKATVVSVLLQI